MDCTETRTHMLAARRSLLPPERADALRTHLQECDACRRADAADAALTSALARLPRRDAPDALKRRLVARWAPGERRWPRHAAKVVAAVGLMGALAAGTTSIVRAKARSDAMVTEAVNDYLRVLYSENPVEVKSGGIHQVKPWFEGRVDFAPAVAFAGDQDFPLEGGSVAYFMDRKAATFVYRHGLHMITLFVFPANGLPWPKATVAVDGHPVYARTSRGFHALMWKQGDLGYALVSDASEGALRELARKIEDANANAK